MIVRLIREGLDKSVRVHFSRRTGRIQQSGDTRLENVHRAVLLDIPFSTNPPFKAAGFAADDMHEISIWLHGAPA